MAETFEEFLTTSRVSIPILGFIINILLSALLAGLGNGISSGLEIFKRG